MQAAKICTKHPVLLLIILLILIGNKCYPQNVPLVNAYAHNDYSHKHPLYDALDNGFRKVEADVYLRNGKLIVAHILPILSRSRTLEGLYLAPMQQYINNEGNISSMLDPLLLMIDIKSGANETYAALQLLLEKYRPILSSYQDGVFIQRQLTIVITGNRPNDEIKEQQNRLAFLDEDLLQVKRDTLSKNVYQTASCKYAQLLKWKGKGSISPTERQRLCAYVASAHLYGKKVRLWASPENTMVWKELLNCGVDFINTDKLVALKNFLTSDGQKNYARVN